MGFAQVIAEISAQLEEAYYAQLRAFLRKFVLVEFEPAVRLRIRAAETTEDGPVTFLVALTVHPRDASGFPRLVGRLATPFEEPQPTNRPRLRKTESTSGVCSATKFLSADSSRCGATRAVVDKRTHFGPRTRG